MRYLFLLLLASTCFARDCSVPDALVQIRPGAEWALGGDAYEGLEWLDKSQTKPSQSEVNQAQADCQTNKTVSKAQKAQAVADAQDKGKTADERIDALLKVLGL